MNQPICASAYQSHNYMNENFVAQEWNRIISISWQLLPPIGPKTYRLWKLHLNDFALDYEIAQESGTNLKESKTYHKKISLFYSKESLLKSVKICPNVPI